MLSIVSKYFSFHAVTYQGNGITTDSSGNVYVSGWTETDFDGNSNNGSTDALLVKFNSSGTKQWSKQIGSSAHDYAHSVTTDSYNNILITGYTLGSFDGNTNIGGEDIFLVKYNSSGVKQ